MKATETFCRQVRARSQENREALFAVRALPGQMVSILRQELDSMVRVIYLLSLKDDSYRQELIGASVAGKKWTRPNSKKIITDREMVELANYLHGWTESVYLFGCAFIHLSAFHDHRNRDPLSLISAEERASILKHLRQYHGGPIKDSPAFSDIVPLLPMVFDKIAGNLECYVENLELGKGVDD